MTAETTTPEDTQPLTDWSRFARRALLVDAADACTESPGTPPVCVPTELVVGDVAVPLVTRIHYGAPGAPGSGWSKLRPLNVQVTRQHAAVVEALVPTAALDFDPHESRYVLRGQHVRTGAPAEVEVLVPAEDAYADAGYENVTVVLVRFYAAEVLLTHVGSEIVKALRAS